MCCRQQLLCTSAAQLKKNSKELILVVIFSGAQGERQRASLAQKRHVVKNL
jgi:hypothetical protein